MVRLSKIFNGHIKIMYKYRVMKLHKHEDIQQSFIKGRNTNRRKIAYIQNIKTISAKTRMQDIEIERRTVSNIFMLLVHVAVRLEYIKQERERSSSVETR